MTISKKILKGLPQSFMSTKIKIPQIHAFQKKRSLSFFFKKLKLKENVFKTHFLLLFWRFSFMYFRGTFHFLKYKITQVQLMIKILQLK